jgi:tripartite-type tricarboxylate transporter receptor subunit TctC
LGAGAVTAETAEEFYAKKPQMKIIISSSPGGGYDFFGRMMTRYLPKYLPGSPLIVAQNMPGGGGITAANYLYNIAPKDGTVIALIDRGIPTAALLYGEDSKSQFDSTKFNWLGSLSKEIGVGVVWKTSPVQTLEQAKTKQVVFGANGQETDSAMYARLANTLLGTKIKTVVGYPGQTEYYLAMEKGETDGLFFSGWSGPNALLAKTAHEKGDLRFFLQMSRKRLPEFGDTPAILELLPNPDDQAIVNVLLARLDLGRPLVAPPDVPADRIALLRKAIQAVTEDPEAQAEAPKGGNVIDAILGEQHQQMIKDLYATPEPVKKRIQEIVRIPN